MRGNRLTGVSVENFKAFGFKQTLEIKPITLLFGPNSAGKSSFLHAMLLMRHAFETGDVDPESTYMGEIDLGSFRSYVYKHDISLKVELGFNISSARLRNLPEDWTMKYLIAYNTPSQSAVLSGIKLFFPNKMEMIFEDVSKSRNILTLNSITVLDQEIDDHVKYNRSLGLPDSILLFFNKLKSMFRGYKEEDIQHIMTIGLSNFSSVSNNQILGSNYRVESYYTSSSLRILNSFLSRDIDFFSDDTNNPSELHRLSRSRGFERDERGIVTRILQVLIDKAPNDLYKERSLSLKNIFNSLNYSSENIEDLDGSRPIQFFRILEILLVMDYMANDIKNTLISMNLKVRQEVEKITYLGPFRHYPERGGFDLLRKSERLDSHGKFAWALLHKNSDSLEKINNWLGKDRMDTKYELVLREYYDDSQIQNFISHSDSLNRLLSDQDPSYRTLQIIDRNYKIPVSHRDIGVGISQVVPVLASAYALEEAIIVIEQPEIHLHPKLQSELGDMFIENHHRNVFILETHSEHLILRLLKRVRENSNIDDANRIINFNNISVFYVKPSDQGSQLISIGITHNGDFSSPWPEGFFEERYEELF